MKKLTIGLLKEGKTPPDRRVALNPGQCKDLLLKYPQLTIIVQPSPIRCFSDAEYLEAGISLSEDLSTCDVLMGIKEVPIDNLIPEKHYFFFSHTIKKQPYNRKLLQAILEKGIKLNDYETLTNKDEERIVAFGRYAGIVGAYNGILTYGKKYNLFDFKPAHTCFDLKELMGQFDNITVPPIKIAVTGTGRVGQGVKEILTAMHIKEVSIDDFLEKPFDYPVFVMLRSKDYNLPINENQEWDSGLFHTQPQLFKSNFSRFAKKADILMASAYWNPKAPVLFTKQEMAEPDFKLKVIADITCDIEGSIPSTLKPSTIADPVYDYNPRTQTVEPPYSSPDHISVMAVDNLPCELPRNSSTSFGEQLSEHIIPRLINEDTDEVITRGTITENGQLTSRFAYLADYVAGE